MRSLIRFLPLIIAIIGLGMPVGQVNASVSIVYQESDWYFNVEQTSVIYIYGNSNRACNQPGADPYLWLYDSSGNLVTQDDDGNHNYENQCVSSKIVIELTPDTYTIKAGYCCSQRGLGTNPYGQYTYELVIQDYMLIDGTTTTTSTTTTSTTTTTIPNQPILYGSVSENQTLYMSAPEGNIFTEVLYANYGLEGNEANCISSTAFDIIESLAVGNTEFSVAATNAVFGDPCSGQEKTLTVEILYGVAPTTTTTTTVTSTTTTTTSTTTTTTTLPPTTTTTVAPTTTSTTEVLPSTTSSTTTTTTTSTIAPTTTSTSTTTTTAIPTTTTSTTTVPATTSTSTTLAALNPTTTSTTSTTNPQTTTSTTAAPTTTSTTVLSSTTTTALTTSSVAPAPPAESTTSLPLTTTTVNTSLPPTTTVPPTPTTVVTQTTTTTTAPKEIVEPPKTAQEVIAAIEEVDSSDAAGVSQILSSDALAEVEEEQIIQLIEEINFEEFSEEESEIIMAALSDAPDEVKAVFQNEVNIFSDPNFGTYVPIGSNINVEQRRVLVAAGATIMAAAAPAAGRGRR